MGTIEIKKVERKVTVGKKGEQRQQVKKTYGKKSKKSAYKASAMRQGATLSTQLYSELTGEDTPEPGNSEENGGGSSSSESGNGGGPVNP